MDGKDGTGGILTTVIHCCLTSTGDRLPSWWSAAFACDISIGWWGEGWQDGVTSIDRELSICSRDGRRPLTAGVDIMFPCIKY